MAFLRSAPGLDLRDALRRRLGIFVFDSLFEGMARLSRYHPHAAPKRHKVEVFRDIPYRPGTMHDLKLDVYRPLERNGPLPIVLYVHGGAFRILSKDSHWVMALGFARRGYVVVNVDYRLTPRHPYPAALEDCCAALAWVASHGERYGGDLDRLVFAGESAGANLVTALALVTSYARKEPWAREVFELGITPRAVLPACGVLQVSDPRRFRRRKERLSAFIEDCFVDIFETYVGLARDGDDCELSDPLLVLERGLLPDRPLPPFFAAVGTKDPLLDDTRRLKAALDRLGVPCEARYYPGEMHAFHALYWRTHAKACWEDTFAFLDRHLARSGHSFRTTAAPSSG